jgi:trans-aconitate methyltransferase
MEFPQEFDAVFSNAALHWMLDAQGVVRTIAKALRKGGRLMAEMGGKGNIRHIERALQAVLPRYYGDAVPAKRTYFPSVGEYAGLLEADGLEVRMAQLFDRPTPLAGEDGMANWIKQFKWYYFEDLPSQQREKALSEVVEELRPALWKANAWYADYRRLRIHAVKV